MCFDERRGLFEKMFMRGEMLTEVEMNLFQGQVNAENIEKLFKNLNKMVKVAAR